MTAPATDSFEYRPEFYDYIEQGVRQSAARILPLVAAALRPAGVLDVGCGRGLWLAAWQPLGVTDVFGVDGPYLELDRLAIPPAAFRVADITQPTDLGRRWDLVQCLEVGEHLPAAAGPRLVENLARHGDRILFSAAEPGQGGHNHLNEQPLEYWRALFAAAGYRAYDVVRPAVHADPAVEPWYRFNALLYVHERAVPALTAEVVRTALDPQRPIPRFANWSWRLRCAVLRFLPAGLVTRLAVLKNRLRRHS